METLHVTRKHPGFIADLSRVIIQFYDPGGPDRIRNIIRRVTALTGDACRAELEGVMEEFADRHKDLEGALLRNYHRINNFVEQPDKLSHEQRLLLGSYFSHEYSIESAALFNPSIVLHPDQGDLPEGSKRYILSFRAIGEGHVSSITFRSGVINKGNHFIMDPVSPFVEKPIVEHNYTYDKEKFLLKLLEMPVEDEICALIFNRLPNRFLFNELQESVRELKKHKRPSLALKETVELVFWLAEANYEESFQAQSNISERVIYPVSHNERNGIEDARFVRFVDDNGTVSYYATYTAYSGQNILPMLLRTKNFVKFTMSTLSGAATRNKGMALFPRKIRGRYVMISRHDGENLYISSSANIFSWNEIHVLTRPREPWEFIQIGNCGSPIETEKGWLLLTHGVGPLRKYCIGAELLDLENPSKIIGRLKDPLLVPSEYERDGYVPNVVYSCGAVLHNDTLIIPYGISDTRSGFATVRIQPLLRRLLAE